MKNRNRLELETIDRTTWTWLLITLAIWLTASVSNAFITERPDPADQAERLVRAEISRGPHGLR
jgi:hypothetical protein